MNAPKIISFYLPQFHTIVENDHWWGKGFTEWTTVNSAKKYFQTHQQPVEPGKFGYYNLLEPEVFHLQTQLAKENQIDAFCFYHYWFGNSKTLLDGPLKLYLEDKSIDFSYMFCWANQSWERNWYSQKGEILLPQEYPGIEDVKKHLNYLAPFLNDARYLQYNEKPIFMVHDILESEVISDYIALYKKYSKEITGKEIFLLAGYNSRENKVSQNLNKLTHFEAKVGSSFSESISSINLTIKNRILDRLHLRKKPYQYQSENVTSQIIHHFSKYPDRIPMIVPNWDNTPRKQKEGFILSPITNTKMNELFLEAFQVSFNNKLPFIFIKSWNEWAEGNYLEPDKQNGDQLLQSVKKAILIAKHSNLTNPI